MEGNSSKNDYPNMMRNIRTNLATGNKLWAAKQLQIIIPRIDNDLFLEHVKFLLQNILKLLESNLKNTAINVNLIRTSSCIFKKIHEIQISNCNQLNRELSATIIPSLIKRLIKNDSHKSEEFYYSAQCLIFIAKLFPAIINENRYKIENYLLEHIEIIQSSNEYRNLNINLKMIGFCYCETYLSGINGLMIRWCDFFSKLLNSFITFTKHPSFSNVRKPLLKFSFNQSKPFEIFKIDNDEHPELSLSMMKKLYFLTYSLCYAINGHFSIKLLLPIEAILECMNLLKIIATSTTKNHKLSIYKSAIILDNVFIILKSLIISCQSNILSYSRLIIHLLLDTIEWMTNNKCTNQEHLPESIEFQNLHSTILKFLTEYFTYLNYNTNISNHESPTILNFILEKIDTSSITKNDLFAQTVQYSIDCLSTMINHSPNIIIHSNNWPKICEKILPLLLKLYRSFHRLPPPFEQEECRLKLFETIQSMLLNFEILGEMPIDTIVELLHEANRLEHSSLIRRCTFKALHQAQSTFLSYSLNSANKNFVAQDMSNNLNGEKSTENNHTDKQQEKADNEIQNDKNVDTTPMIIIIDDSSDDAAESMNNENDSSKNAESIANNKGEKRKIIDYSDDDDNNNNDNENKTKQVIKQAKIANNHNSISFEKQYESIDSDESDDHDYRSDKSMKKDDDTINNNDNNHKSDIIKDILADFVE